MRGADEIVVSGIMKGQKRLAGLRCWWDFIRSATLAGFIHPIAAVGLVIFFGF
jgi:hypothetical protein